MISNPMNSLGASRGANLEKERFLETPCRYIFAQIYLHIHGGWSIFAQELMEGSPRSSQSVNSLTHEKAEVNIRSEQVLFWNDKKTSTTFIIHIQKRNNHQSTLLSAKNYIQLWSLLLPNRQCLWLVTPIYTLTWL